MVVGLQPNLIYQTLLFIINTKPIYVTMLAFTISTAIILSIISAWVFVRGRLGRKI